MAVTGWMEVALGVDEGEAVVGILLLLLLLLLLSLEWDARGLDQRPGRE